MSNHRAIQRMLYEYLRDNLPVYDRLKVERHTAACLKCRMELERMRSTLAVFAVPAAKPSEERSADYWQEFSTTVLRKSISHRSRQRNAFVEAVEWIEELFALHARYAFAATGTLVALLVVFALWTFRPGGRESGSHDTSASLEHPASPGLVEAPVQSVLTPERVSQYFRKSKTLLVGVTNQRTDQAEPLDFSKERRVSRDLIREARYLRQQPIDPRTRRLMSDMERILIELSNVEGHKDPSSMTIIRSGIHHENLLFKIRMAEAMYDSSNAMYAVDRR